MNPRSARTNVAVAVLCALLWSGFAPPAGADDGRAAPPYDATVLSEIAGEVMRKALTRPAPSTPVAVSPDAKAVPQVGGDGTELAPDSPLTHIAPAREGITVPVPPGAAAAAKAKPEVTSTGYRSNSPRRGHGKAPAPGASGLDPALEAHAASVRATGRPFVYGFVKLRVPVDTAVEKDLAGSGITLLGPHDDLHKARLPIGALAAIASLPEVAWLGASPPARKLSAERAAQLGPEGRTRGIGAATALPSSSVSSRTTLRVPSGESSRPPAPRWASTIPSSAPIGRWRRPRPSTASPPSTSCCSSSSSA